MCRNDCEALQRESRKHLPTNPLRRFQTLTVEGAMVEYDRTITATAQTSVCQTPACASPTRPSITSSAPKQNQKSRPTKESSQAGKTSVPSRSGDGTDSFVRAVADRESGRHNYVA